jgi:hypothetical protein
MVHLAAKSDSFLQGMEFLYINFTYSIENITGSSNKEGSAILIIRERQRE